MFEFHGWITIRVKENDSESIEATTLRENRAIEQVRAAISNASNNFSFFDVRRTSNCMIVLMAHGLGNHRYQPLIELFEQIAQMLPDSYGLLYVHDDEQKGSDNAFRVWRLALRRFTEHDDPFLSRYIPTVEILMCEVDWNSNAQPSGRHLFDVLKSPDVSAPTPRTPGGNWCDRHSSLSQVCERGHFCPPNRVEKTGDCCAERSGR